MKHCHVFCQSSRFTKKYLWPRVLRITLSCFWNKYHCHHYNQSNSLDWLSGYSRSKIIKKYSETLKLQSAGKNTNPSNIWWKKNLLKKWFLWLDLQELFSFRKTYQFKEKMIEESLRAFSSMMKGVHEVKVQESKSMFWWFFLSSFYCHTNDER